MIIRPDYIQAIKPFMDQPLVKILAGVRRCGKSTIFEMLVEELRSRGIPDECIIQKRYTEMDIPEDISAKAVYEELISRIQGKGRCYLLLDEIQEIKGWERCVNSLMEGRDVDIYVTGSNSKLMSSELSTYLTGRFVSIPVYTLSFKEYLTFKKEDSRSSKELLEEYIRFGGFPIIALGRYDEQNAYQIVNGIYHTVISRDIVKRHRINRQDLFDRIVKYLIENMGKTFSANSIAKFLKSEHRTVSVESIYNYIRWLEQAFIIYPCHRYDIQGKSILKTKEKYYLADVTLKYCLLGYNRKMLDGVLENIVFLEMKRRGYDVYIGKNGTKEIDFIGVRRNEKIYVQVCVQLPENSDRKVGNLMEIQDHYPKYVVTTNSMDVGIENGIRIVHLHDFLLSEIW
ncbi:MAG TPA: ATP-binding protein [Candidatus Blautia ornithocaccae]|nr:ATP-binding protein [Candidatus Blautia ornithocaccae]